MPLRRLTRLLALAPILLPFGLSAPAQAATFTSTNGGKSIRMTGEIVPGDARRLALAILRSNENGAVVERLYLHSTGGQVLESVKLGGLVTKAKLDTVVSDDRVCVSACVTVFAAGKQKVVFPTSRVGVHNASDRDRETGQASLNSGVTLAVIRFYKSIGVPASVLGKIATTLPGEVEWLDVEDYKAWKVEMLSSAPNTVTTEDVQPLY